MRRIGIGLWVGVVLWALAPSDAHAQRRFYPGGVGPGFGGISVGVGVDRFGATGPFVGPAFGGFGPYGYGGFGPGFGFFPPVYNGFYSNGFSLYGPPVPTYAPIPGVFGGSDQLNYGTPPGIFAPRYTPYNRHFLYQDPGKYGDGWDAPGIGFGLTRGSGRGALSTHTPPNFDTDAPGLTTQSPDLTPRVHLRPMHIEVRCPPAAEIQIDRNPTAQQGASRLYVTPALSTEEEVTYEVRATYEENGKLVTKLRSATGKGGERVTVDFLAAK